MLYPIATISAKPCVLIVPLQPHFLGSQRLLLGDLDVYTSWESSTAGAWLLAAVPEARSSLLHVLSIAGTHRNAFSQNKDTGLHCL